MTYGKDPYELIDYESDFLSEDVLTINENGTLYRTNEYLHFIPKDKETNNIHGEKLFEILCDEKYRLKFNQLKLDDIEQLSTPNSAWFILKKKDMSPRSNTYRLTEGDIVKIGRINFLIRSIKFTKDENISHSSKILIEVIKKNKNSPTKSRFSGTNPLKKSKSFDEKRENKTCRICYCEDETIENPLIQPCACSGSMKYIHLNCLKHWLKNSSYNLIQSNESFCVYSFKQPHCELCQTKYSDYIRHKGKLYEILDLHTNVPFHSYMILESLTLDKHDNKFFYIVSLDKPKIKIGRAHESDLILSDLSVSRHHCSLSIDNKSRRVFLHDDNSRCGTLLLIQSNYITLALEMKLNIQIGNTHFEILNKKNFSLFSCCDASEKLNDDFYYKQNEVDIDRFKNLRFKAEFDFVEEEEFESDIDIECDEKKVENDIIAKKKTIFQSVNSNEDDEEVKIEVNSIDDVVQN